MSMYDDGLGKGKLGKAQATTDAGIPVNPAGGTQQYPQAEANYEVLDGTPAEGTPLYPEAAAAPSSKLSRFRVRGYRDVWAAVLFGVLVLFSIIWSIVMLATYKYNFSDNSSVTYIHASSSYSSTRPIGAGAIAAACGLTVLASLVTSFALLIVAQRLPVQMIYIANVLTIVMFAISAIMAFVRKEAVAGVLMLICTVLQALWLYLVRSRIPFAAALLRTAAKLMAQYKMNFVFNIALCIVMCGYLVLWGYGVAAPIDRFYNDKGNGGYGFVIGLLVFIVLWVSQVFPNVMHVTASGLIATWYYAGANNMPPNPTVASFKRATTTSFGSICFGSLVVAVIQFVRWLVESSNNNENNFLRCVLECILRCIDNLVQYFNRYAFVHIAIYGCGYIEGAKRTFALCEQCFFAAYFNDCLVVPTLSMFTFAISILYGVIAGVAASSWPLGVLVFLTAALVHQLMFVGVDSAVTTIFVCFAENPDALRESDPELFAAIHAADMNGTNNNAAPPV